MWNTNKLINVGTTGAILESYCCLHVIYVCVYVNMYLPNFVLLFRSGVVYILSLSASSALCVCVCVCAFAHIQSFCAFGACIVIYEYSDDFLNGGILLTSYLFYTYVQYI